MRRPGKRLCGGQGSEEPGGGEKGPKEKTPQEPRRSGGSAGRPHRPELEAGRGRRARAHPPGPTLSGGSSSSAGRSGRPRPHPRPSRACGSAPRPPPLLLHAPRADRQPGGVWAAPARLGSSTCCRGCRRASLPAAAPGTAAYGVFPPPPRPRLRPPRQSDSAPPARVTAGTAGPHPVAQVWGKADLPPSRRSAPGPAGLSALRDALKALCYTEKRDLQRCVPHPPQEVASPHPAETQGPVQTPQLPGPLCAVGLALGESFDGSFRPGPACA